MVQICDERHGLQQNESAPPKGMLAIRNDASGATREKTEEG